MAILTVVFLLGCSSNKGKIEGTKWSSDAGMHEGQSVPAGKLKFEFRRDGSLVYVAGPLTLTGKYSLGMGDRVTLNLDQELAGTKQHVEKVVIANDKLTMTDGDGTSITFSKVN